MAFDPHDSGRVTADMKVSRVIRLWPEMATLLAFRRVPVGSR